MLTLEKFKEKLDKDSVKIIEEESCNGISILRINKLPPSIQVINSNRRKIHKYNKFIIKSADKQKFSSDLKPDLEELKLEILAVRKFMDKVPLLDKLAIIKQSSGGVFLVEELLMPYDEFKEDRELNDRVSKLIEKIKEIFKGGDFKIENIVYNKTSKRLLFTDVFPSKTHLIGEN